MHDVAIELARCGGYRFLPTALFDALHLELGNEHPDAAIAFVRQRYFRVLFSSPMWGVLELEKPT